MVRKTDTIKITGGATYSKVADRLKVFREDWPNSKVEQDDNYKEVEKGQPVRFEAWLWKDKKEYLEVLKAIGNAKEARGSADANASSMGIISVKEKDYEKLQTIALGRALAALGYMASGDIASFEEMNDYYQEKAEQEKQYIENQMIAFENAKTLDELKELWIACTKKANVELVVAKDKRKRELEAKAESKKPQKEKVQNAKA